MGRQDLRAVHVGRRKPGGGGEKGNGRTEGKKAEVMKNVGLTFVTWVSSPIETHEPSHSTTNHG